MTALGRRSKQSAKEACSGAHFIGATLREQGHDAYYYHGPNLSAVTLNLFTFAMQQKKLVGTIDQTEALRGVVNINGWNQYHIIARGSTPSAAAARMREFSCFT